MCYHEIAKGIEVEEPEKVCLLKVKDCTTWLRLKIGSRLNEENQNLWKKLRRNTHLSKILRHRII